MFFVIAQNIGAANKIDITVPATTTVLIATYKLILQRLTLPPLSL
jgi:hypothetical protein